MRGRPGVGRWGLIAAVVCAAWASASCLEASTPTSPSTLLTPSTDALADTIWFDADRDALIPVKVKPQVDDSVNRDSRWLPKAKRVPAPKASDRSAAGANAASGAAGTGLFGTGLSIGHLFGWLLLAVLVGLTVLMIAKVLSKSEFDPVSRSTARRVANSAGLDQQTMERMKHLPAELRRSGVNLRDEAERLMLEANYDQAIIVLFAHQLLLLDRAGLLRLNRGKTNRRYVRESRGADPQCGQWLQATVTAFERSYFGRHSILAEDFSRLWADNELLEQSIQRRKEAAA